MTDFSEPRQLILPFEFNPVYRLDNFVVCPGNRDAFLSIKDLCQSAYGSKILYLYGEQGTGKTHLAQGLINHKRETDNTFEGLVFSCSLTQPFDAGIYSLPEAGNMPDLLVIENADYLHRITDGEDGIFALFNLFNQQEKPILITSKVHPTQLIYLHERLRSRFYSGNTIKIAHLDENTCIRILKKLATDHQVIMPDKVIQYIILRAPRNPADIQKIFHEMDALALKLKKPITINVARKVLANY
ncbi:DnaA ATPase domain-containing protein [candidate division CSSED10-310 bacterium]|uniref:DnaA ATPase domain-containing protein n=1 Tax=candidate division CSSED10-310 bacterium TaxID=2855610 RepID=A0ABV6YVS2_UNCC1